MRELRVLLYVAVLVAAAASCLAQGIQGLEVHGYIQNRFYSPEAANAKFAIDRVSLSAIAKLPEGRTGYVEWYYHPWITNKVFPDAATGANITAEQSRFYLESAYYEFPLGPGALRVGKGRQLNFGITPTYGNRKTSQYGILAETFTQDRILGAQYVLKVPQWDMGVSVYDDLRLGDRKIGDASGTGKIVKHLCDRDDTANIGTGLAASAKIGQVQKDFRWHLSGAVGKLTQVDANMVLAAAGGISTANTTHAKWGVDATYSKNAFFSQAEYYAGEFSFMRTDGYSVTLGYEPKDADRVYVRYASLKNNVAATANQFTWDTQQLTFGYIHPITKNVWLELDYEKNTENPPAGVANVKNDLGFVELFTAF